MLGVPSKEIKKKFSINGNQANFLNRIIKDAKVAQRFSIYQYSKNKFTFGVFASVLIAMSIFFSKFGRRTVDGANNVLNIKVGSIKNFTGASVERRTLDFNTGSHEGHKGRYKFPVYGSVLDCFLGFAERLLADPKYKKCFTVDNPNDFITLFEQANGTKTLYDKKGNRIFAQEIKQIINKYNLDFLDLKRHEIGIS